MRFSFHALFVDSDQECCRLSFADRNDGNGEHYFIMDRLEESPDEALPDMANVYTEMDDQGGGGFGGIRHVVLERDTLTVQYNSKHNFLVVGTGMCRSIQISYALNEDQFLDLRDVLKLIMRGYESQLELHKRTTIDPRWLTSTVIDLARSIYDGRAFDKMPILADALMDAGCNNQEIIEHCRGESEHVRGCWIVDLLLGRE